MITSNVKAIMKGKGVTLRGLVDLSGVSKQTILTARSDEGLADCRLSTLGRIANALEVPLKDLFDGEYEVVKKSKPQSV